MRVLFHLAFLATGVPWRHLSPVAWALAGLPAVLVLYVGAALAVALFGGEPRAARAHVILGQLLAVLVHLVRGRS